MSPARSSKRLSGPGEATDLGWSDAGRMADVGLEQFGPSADSAQVRGSPADRTTGHAQPRIAPAPRGEARLHRLELLARPLVGVGHDQLLG